MMKLVLYVYHPKNDFWSWEPVIFNSSIINVTVMWTYYFVELFHRIIPAYGYWDEAIGGYFKRREATHKRNHLFFHIFIKELPRLIFIIHWPVKVIAMKCFKVAFCVDVFIIFLEVTYYFFFHWRAILKPSVRAFYVKSKVLFSCGFNLLVKQLFILFFCFVDIPFLFWHAVWCHFSCHSMYSAQRWCYGYQWRATSWHSRCSASDLFYYCGLAFPKFCVCLHL